MAQLTIANLNKSFGTFVALEDISISIEAGEFICLLGASGCGKTTLLRLIAGLETPTGGKINLAGEDLTAIPSHKRNIGMVFQSLALFPHLDVAGNIAYGLRLQGQDKAATAPDVERLLQMVGLEGLGLRKVSALSGGQRQRVAIARALALKPSIFLMDEPFSALDAALRDQMQIEVKRIQRDLGITTIFVTHDQREAMTLADRIVVMNEGRIEQADAPDTLYAKPKSRFVAEFIGTNNILDLDVSEGRVALGQNNLGAPQGALSESHGNVAVAIRPEAIELSSPKESSALTGTVKAQRRLGPVLEREIYVDGKSVFQSAFAGQSPELRTGETVALEWDWDKTWVLPQ